MFTKSISINILDSYKDAPNYDAKKVPLLKMESCIIVGKGMANGESSIDIQLVDENGKEFVIMTTGKIMEMIAGAIKGKRERDQS